MRFGVIAACVTLLAAGCSEVQPQAEQGALMIECALGPGSEFVEACAVEKAELVLVIRHQDGSFRRLDAETFAALDGADAAEVTQSTEMVEVAVSGDRYRWKTGAFAAQ